MLVPQTTSPERSCLYPRHRDGRIAQIEAGLAESRWVEKQLGRSVVKAFNNIDARHLLENGRPAGAPDGIALPVAGDDPEAKAVVMKLVDRLGFDPVDARWAWRFVASAAWHTCLRDGFQR